MSIQRTMPEPSSSQGKNWRPCPTIPTNCSPTCKRLPDLPRSEERRVGSDWSSDVCSSDLVNPANNAGTIIISGKELEALPDDPDELLTDLQALAGPSAGPNGGQLYIDGFTAGQLPPKSSIREIRINQNPFSAEYDKLGYG